MRWLEPRQSPLGRLLLSRLLNLLLLLLILGWNHDVLGLTISLQLLRLVCEVIDKLNDLCHGIILNLISIFFLLQHKLLKFIRVILCVHNCLNQILLLLLYGVLITSIVLPLCHLVDIY